MEKLYDTAIGVVLAIALSGAIFIGANKLFDLTRSRWAVFTTAVGALAGFLPFVLFAANDLIVDGVVTTVVATLIGAFTGFLLGTVEPPPIRLAIGSLGGLALGLLMGFQSQGVFGVTAEGVPVLLPARPALDPSSLILWSLIGLAAGGVWWVIRGRRGSPLRTLILWGTLGWFLAAWLIPDLVSGTRNEAMVAAGVTGLGLGATAGLNPLPNSNEQYLVGERSRSWIFLVPAMVFIGATLVIPTIRTIYLSFRDERGGEFVGFQNYADLWNDRTINVSDFSSMFTSQVFIWGVVVLVVGLLVGVATARRRKEGTFIASGASNAAMAGAVFLLVFALFSTLRGTVINNLWWVFTVTVIATAAGLAVAVLADRARFENVAKSMIFMPMAISFVGASIIWRFVYQAKQPTPAVPDGGQTGLLNALWVGLGQLSNSTTQKYIALAILAVIVVALGYVAMRGFRAGALGVAWGSGLALLFFGWFMYALLAGIGGWDPETGFATPLLFVQDAPFNNVWLMVVLIWIQTGFAMVIFSAAIKAVPGELIEASRVDGATETQTFWQITVPSIAPTIGVVVTTLIVVVLKVFDIVKVMTNGNFGTQVIANEMWQRAFTELNFGLGSALAVALFVGVLPILYLNIRRMQEGVAQ